jgi:hypothetical protein
LNNHRDRAARLDRGCLPDVIAQDDCRSQPFHYVEAQSDVLGWRDSEALLDRVLPILLKADAHSFNKHRALLQDEFAELTAGDSRRLFERRWVMRSTIVERNASVLGGILA